MSREVFRGSERDLCAAFIEQMIQPETLPELIRQLRRLTAQYPATHHYQ